MKMKIIRVFSRFTTILFFFFFINSCLCNICDTCLCYKTDGNVTFNCHGKQIGTSFQLSLLTSDYDEISHLILSENNLISLPVYIFEEPKIKNNLKILDLSHNLLNEMEEGAVLNTLNNLQILNLSYNQLQPPKNGIKIPSIQKLYLSNNLIDTMEKFIEGPHLNLTYLDLSHNYLKTLQNPQLELAPNLRVLDFSFNQIVSLETDNLLKLKYLETVKINNNHIQTIPNSVFPESLIKLDISFNKLKTLPANLIRIQILNVAHNYIYTLGDTIKKFEQLEYLNVSGNTLETFPNIEMKNLKILDISDNKLVQIPESLNLKNLPVLQTLVISGNPLKELKFENLRLKSLIVQNISELESIGANSLINLKSYAGKCLNLTICNNKKLNFVNEKAFGKINVCYVDLSNNNLEYISPNITMISGMKLKYGIDLQGNPFNCNCSLQWMLNDFVPWIYSINPELLNNVRCAYPEALKLMRMVHWYKWDQRVFCYEHSAPFSRMTLKTASILADGSTIILQTSNGMIYALAISGVLLLILVAIGIAIARHVTLKQSRRNRRL